MTRKLRRLLVLVWTAVVWLHSLQLSNGTPEVVNSRDEIQRRNNNKQSVLEQLWGSLQHHMNQQPQPQQQKSSIDTSPTTSGNQHANTVDGPHLATRGGPYVTARRRALLEHGLHRHYSTQFQQEREQNNATEIQENFQHMFELYRYELLQNHEHTTTLDRTTSLHRGLPPFPPSKRRANLQTLREMFQHAFDSYMYHAWPASEVRPISCSPGEFDLVKIKGLTLLDSLDTLVVFGNTTEFARSVERLRRLHETEHLFHIDTKVSLFETTIRVLGGLLSAHQLAERFLNRVVFEKDVFDAQGQVRWGYEESIVWRNVEHNVCPVVEDFLLCREEWLSLQADDAYFYNVFHDECRANHGRHNHTAQTTTMTMMQGSDQYWSYDGFLLELATDLGERLLPAFSSKTGIPYGTVNLLSGVPKDETTEASLAGAGTLTLEFELLSRLTGDEKYGKAAKLASRALWMRRSLHKKGMNLFGKHIDIQSGAWTETLSGIGSNSDSFLEYLVKHYYLFPEDEGFWKMATTAYSGVYENSRLGEWYVDTGMTLGAQHGRSRHVLESLMAFYPGLQVLLGETTPAARSLNSFFIVRELLGFLPERFNFGTWTLDGGRGDGSLHPLRPELLESCYFLHKATQGLTDGDSSGWLWAADFAIQKLQDVTKAECGYASIRDLRVQTTGSVNGVHKPEEMHLVDDMPSFFLSETLKYLYLAFDENNILHKDQEHEWIFTTEAHPIHHVKKAAGAPTRFDRDIASLKSLLRDKVNRRKSARTNEEITTQIDDRRENLLDEHWTVSTTYTEFTQSLSSVDDEIALARDTLFENVTSLDVFFRERDVVTLTVPNDIVWSPFRDLSQPDLANFANRSFKHNGIGTGKLLRKSCPNIYSSDLLWLIALNGGSVDYADAYISVLSDNLADHPFSTAVAADPATLLGVMGRGVHPLEMERKEENENVCSIITISRENENLKSEAISNVRTDQQKQDEIIQHVEPKDLHISSIDDGVGFTAHIEKTGDKLVTLFVEDETQRGLWYALVYSGYFSPDKPSNLNSKMTFNSWSDSGHRYKQPLDGHHPQTKFYRKAVTADLSGNSFSCEVQLLRIEKGSDEAVAKEILVTLPCAPALFGRTHMANLAHSENGITVEALAAVPPEGATLACSGDEDVSSENDEIHFVNRGECTFHTKARNMKDYWGAEAVVVVNTEDDELFFMSRDEEHDANLSEDLPTTVMVTGLDGEDLLSTISSESANDNRVLAKISIERQKVSVGNDILVQGDPHSCWPGVLGANGSLQIFSKGAWGLVAVGQKVHIIFPSPPS